MKKRARRTKRSGLTQGDMVEVRIKDVWLRGQVSRSLFKGTEVDVRLEDGRVMKNITSRDVRPRSDGLIVVHMPDGTEPEDE